MCQTHAAVLSVFLPKHDQDVIPVSTEFTQFTLASVEDASSVIEKTRLIQKLSLMCMFRIISAKVNLDFQHLEDERRTHCVVTNQVLVAGCLLTA